MEVHVGEVSLCIVYLSALSLWYLRHTKQHEGLIQPIVKKVNKNQIIKITSSCA